MARRSRRSYDDEEAMGLLFLYGISLVIGFITKYWKIIIVFLIVIFLLFVLIKYHKKIYSFFKNHKDKKYISRLKRKSNLYLKIQELNNKYKLIDLDIFYDSYLVRFKSELSNCNIDDYLLMTIKNKYNSLLEYKKKYNMLLKEYNQYLKEYEELKKYINVEEAKSTGMSIDNYIKYQNMIYENYKVKINCEFKVVIYINYRSNKGKVREKVYKAYDAKTFSVILNEYFEMKNTKHLYQINSRIERAKMSESLRYDVFNRDHHRCCICGMSSSDGAKLEVDHVIPVSKGGKTEMSNLQTLCSRCNIGKSNKVNKLDE